MLVEHGNQVVDLFDCVIDMCFGFGYEINDAVNQLRNDQHQQHANDQKQYEIGKQQRDPASQGVRLDLEEQLSFKNAEKGIEKIGDHKTDDNGAQEAQEPAQPAVEGAEIGDEQDQKEDCRINAKPDDPMLFLLCFHFKSPFIGL